MVMPLLGVKMRGADKSTAEHYELLLLVFVLTPKVGTPRDHLVKRRLKSS